MIANLPPRTMTRGAAYFIGRTITLIRDCRKSRMALSGKVPVPANANVAKMALNMVCFKLTSMNTHVLDTEAEITEFTNVLQVAREVAASVRDSGEGINLAFTGDPVADIEDLITRFQATLSGSTNTAAVAA